jgi:uncharacterized oligopeptide transporter (OPT) family protein
MLVRTWVGTMVGARVTPGSVGAADGVSLGAVVGKSVGALLGRPVVGRMVGQLVVGSVVPFPDGTAGAGVGPVGICPKGRIVLGREEAVLPRGHEHQRLHASQVGGSQAGGTLCMSGVSLIFATLNYRNFSIYLPVMPAVSPPHCHSSSRLDQGD